MDVHLEESCHYGNNTWNTIESINQKLIELIFNSGKLEGFESGADKSESGKRQYNHIY